MLQIAITGGIGSGKTVVAKLFSELGIGIVDADQISHEITQFGAPAYQPIVNHFGSSVITTDQTLNRKQLRKIIFQDTKQKQWLEALLHPLIRQKMDQQLAATNTPYAIAVIPLLIESSYDYQFDRICVIDTSPTLQIQRTCARDHCTAEQVRAILALQASRDQRLTYADDIITNNNDLIALKNRIAELHQLYLSLANTTS